jgi:HAT1-interacting factor 1
VQDYTSALEIQKATLPASSRALASSHYQLGTVLEFTPAGRPAALKHVQAALDGFKLRAKEITTAQAGEPVPDSPDVAAMSAKEREAEARDVAALIGDIEVKIEELNSAPPAFDFIANSINHLLGGAPAPGASGSAAPVADSGPVNDLTSMVRKKKKPAAPAAAPVAAAPAPAAADAAASGAGDKRPAEVDAAGLAKKPKAE